MPRLSPAGWRRLGWLRRYLITARAALLPLTLFACLFGGLLALPWTAGEGLRLLLAMAALLSAHAAANLANDLVAWILGADRRWRFRLARGPHPLAEGWMHPLIHGALLLATAALSGMLGLTVCGMAGPPAYWLAGVGVVLLVLYTWPLERLGLGEPVAFLIWGPLMAGGVYWVVSGDWGPDILVLTSLFGLGPAVAVLGMHLDERRNDAARGVRTLAVILGLDRGPALLAVLALVLVGGALLLAWLTGAWSYLTLLAALPALGRLLSVSLRPRPAARPPRYPAGVWPLWYAPAALRFARASGLALVVAAFLDGTLAAQL